MIARALLCAGIALGVVAPASAETLEDAIIAAYANNPTLEEARLAVRAAHEDENQARAAYFPRVDFTGDYNMRHLEADEPSIFGLSHREVDLAGRTLSLRAVADLYSGGRRHAQDTIAEASVGGAREALRAAEQEVMLRTITAYANVLREEEALRIRQSYVEALEQDLHGAQRRLDVGDVTRTDVAQAQARLARAQAGEAVARSTLEGSRAVFEAIVGFAPGALAPTDAPPNVGVNLDEALASAERINPDLLQARQVEAGARGRVGVERSALEPQVGVISSYDFAEERSDPRDFSQGSTVTARISVPLFEGGYGRARIRQSQINVERAEQRTESQRRQIMADVVTRWHDLESSRRVVDAARIQLEADEAALEGVRREQGIGLRDTLDVLNAQQELLDSRLSFVQAERNAYVGVFELLQAMGALQLESVGLERDTGR